MEPEAEDQISITPTLAEKDGDLLSATIMAPDGFVFDELDDSGDEPVIYFKREED